MPYYCTVPQCTSMAGKVKHVSFHQFPKDQVMAKTWNTILRRNKPYTKYSKVCSLHFTPEDYTLGGKGNWKTLRKNALPSRNLPTEDAEKRRVQSPVQDMLIPDKNTQLQVAQALYFEMARVWQAASQTNLMQDPEDSDATTSDDSSSDDKLEAHPKPPPASAEPAPTTSRPRCDECMKCFKDPDVLFLHRRTHNGRSTLQANPMLANLLNRPTDKRDGNQVNAMAVSMQAYFRNLCRQSLEIEQGATDVDEDAAGVD